jgi:hypothetical protein
MCMSWWATPREEGLLWNGLYKGEVQALGCQCWSQRMDRLSPPSQTLSSEGGISEGGYRQGLEEPRYIWGGRGQKGLCVELTNTLSEGVGTKLWMFRTVGGWAGRGGLREERRDTPESKHSRALTSSFGFYSLHTRSWWQGVSCSTAE